MAKATTKPKRTATDLEALTQQQAAWLIGKPTSWLRNRADLDGRRPDGGYDGSRLVAAFVKDTQANATVPELADEAVHCFDQALGFCDAVHNFTLVSRTIERIKREHGPLGMAAVAELFVALMREEFDKGSYQWHEEDQPPKTEAQIRQDVAAEAKELLAYRIRNEAERERRRDGKMVWQCPKCERYRWARKWRRGAPPAGYVIEDLECDKCFPPRPHDWNAAQ